MKKIILTISLMLPLSAFAIDKSDIDQRYFSQRMPRLSTQERQALNIARLWQKVFCETSS